MAVQLDEQLAAIAGTIRARGAVTDADVLALRRAVYARAHVDRAAAGLVLQLHHQVPKRVPAWDSLYVDVLMDFFYWGREDGVIGESDAAWLVAQIRADGRTEDHSELELLLRIIFRATRCPEELRRLAREATLASVLGAGTALVGDGARRPGSIDRHDVEAIRRLVYGLGGDDGPTIGAGEAEWLIELDHATATADNAPEWRELFVKALTMHLLCGGASPDSVDSDKARWLMDRLDRGQGLTANGLALVANLAREARYVDARIEAHLPRQRPPRPADGSGRRSFTTAVPG
jgi:hypothetical protein